MVVVGFADAVLEDDFESVVLEDFEVEEETTLLIVVEVLILVEEGTVLELWRTEDEVVAGLVEVLEVLVLDVVELLLELEAVEDVDFEMTEELVADFEGVVEITEDVLSTASIEEVVAPAILVVVDVLVLPFPLFTCQS